MNSTERELNKKKEARIYESAWKLLDSMGLYASSMIDRNNLAIRYGKDEFADWSVRLYRAVSASEVSQLNDDNFYRKVH